MANKPSVNILDLLISLYADQMGVEIKYEKIPIHKEK